MSDSCKIGRPRKGACAPRVTLADRVLDLTAGQAMSRAELAAALGLSDRYARKVIAELRADPNAKRLFIERWGLIERDRAGPMYVAIYRKRTDRTQRDARRPSGSPRAVRDYTVKRIREARAASIEGQFAALITGRSEKP